MWRTRSDVAARLKASRSCKKDENEKMADVGRSLLAVALCNKGHAALKKGRLQLAVNFYTQAFEHDEASTVILIHRANAYLKLEKYENAVEDCTEIIELQPNFWKAYALRAQVFQQQLQFDKAMVDLRQAKKLCPRRTNIFDKVRLKCKREVVSLRSSLRNAQLADEAKKLPPRPYVRGDKRFTLGQHILRMNDCLAVIARILDEPGYGTVVWEEDQLDRWRRMQMAARVIGKKKEITLINCDFRIVVNRLESVQYMLKEMGSEGHQAIALAQGFPILLSAYDYHDKLVLEIITEVCKYGDEAILRALLHAQPLPTLLHGLQSDCRSVKTNSFILLDIAANIKPQKVITLLIKEKLFHVLLTSMRSGSVADHDSSVSLFFKLILDPRLKRYLISLPSHILSTDLCGGLIRACRSDRPITRLHGAQAITILLEYDQSKRVNRELVLVPVDASGENNKFTDYSDMPILTLFVNGGVLAAVATLLSKEINKAPEKIHEYAPSVWEDDVELICERIRETVSEFSEFHECSLKSFDFLSGYVQVTMVNAVRGMDFMADGRYAIEILEQVGVWGSFVALLSSFPNSLATLTVQVLAKLCQRDKRVAIHLSNVWPQNSSLILMELARSAHGWEDWQTYQAAMLILAKLAGQKSFLSAMQNPTSFTIIIDLFQVGQSITAVSAGCTCLAVAITNCEDCLEVAEMHASSLVERLLELWCEFRKEEQFRFQIEQILYVLMKKSNRFQETIVAAFKSGRYTDFDRTAAKNHKLFNHKSFKVVRLRIQKVEPAVLNGHEFAKSGINFNKVIDLLSTLVEDGNFLTSMKFADLCAGTGLLSIQLAKHFREAHCFAVNCKRAWVEHTKKLAKHESVQNLTSILSKDLDLLPQALPSRVNVAILCLSLQGIHNLGHLFQALSVKLLPQGKLVLIDDDEYLMDKAKDWGLSEGFNVVEQPKLFEHYSIAVLEKTRISQTCLDLPSLQSYSRPETRTEIVW